MISFWTGIFLAIAVGILIIVIGAFISKKLGKGGSIGGLLGFFIGFGAFLAIIFLAGRVYVVTGHEEFDDYMIFGTQSYQLNDSITVNIELQNGQCMVINSWDTPVIVEYMKYGGYGFGGDTEWVKPAEFKVFEERKIFYFYDDAPPEEISVRGGDSSDEYIRLWLRSKRD